MKKIMSLLFVCVLMLISLVMVACKGKVDTPMGKVDTPMTEPYHYFVGTSFIAEDEYQVGLRKVQRLPGLVVSKEKADVVIAISSGNCVIPGLISIDYREDASSIVNFILTNTVEAIILQKEEATFSELALELESKFAKENVFIRRAWLWLSSKDYYRFLLRLRTSPESIRLMQESDTKWIAGEKFDSYNKIDSQANFKEINDFLLRSNSL